MNTLNELGIQVVAVNGDGRARGILRELERLLQLLVAEDAEGSIELSGMALGATDYDLLDEALGEGEVVAEVLGDAPSRVQETGIPGVWWVSHFNEADELVAEFLEVAWCPEILLAPEEDVREGLDVLRARLFALKHDDMPGR